MTEKKEISAAVSALKDAREAAGLTQAEVGLRMGYADDRAAQGAIGRWESGARDPGSKLLEKWAAALDATLEVVLKA